MKISRVLIIIFIMVIVLVGIALLGVSSKKPRVTELNGMSYEELCKKNKDLWMEMEPWKDGKKISSEKCMGCMIGDNHFCKSEEYVNYIKKIPGMEKMEMQQIQSIDRRVTGLEEAEKSQIVTLSNGETFNLEAKPVAKTIQGNLIRMYSYNSQIPGPLIKVKQGSSVYINFTNSIDSDTTVHWHGIRVKNEFDGVPNVTQKAISPGESFLYKLDFPDDGVYWYHPHIREDLQQELGLYGNILVEPKAGYNNVDREVMLFLDDIRMENGDVDTFSKDYALFALMGRFGNEMLINGETDYKIDIRKNEVLRLYLTNSANTRTFNFSIDELKMKLVGGDSGKYEKESFVGSVIIAPAERYIVEVYFNTSGSYRILHTTPEKTYALGTISVSESQGAEKSVQFLALKENKDIETELEPLKKYLSFEPDYEIDLTIEMPVMGNMDHSMMGMMNDAKPIEWEDDMAAMNEMMTSDNTRWILKDRKSGKENMDINYKVKVGDKKKIRIFNDPDSMHPMQHPIHLHGQRFVILSQDGKQNDNLVWKDTVLVPAGSTVEILVDFTNPGEWMIHCHIAEHLEAGMMASFTVKNLNER